MRIRALANGNVIEAHDDAAKQLIDAGIYEAVGDDEPTSAEVLSPPAVNTATPSQPQSKPAKQTRGRKTR